MVIPISPKIIPIRLCEIGLTPPRIKNTEVIISFAGGCIEIQSANNLVNPPVKKSCALTKSILPSRYGMDFMNGTVSKEKMTKLTIKTLFIFTYYLQVKETS